MKILKLFVLFSLLTATFSFGQKTAQDYNTSGLAKYKLQDNSGAIADFTKAIELEPDNAKAYYNRGSAKAALKDLDGACLDWSKAGELGHSGAYDLIKQYCN